jgi:nucleotide-binding universal stress UspA family protein
MAMRDILVHVGDKKDSGPAVDAALALADRCDAHLVGLAVELPLEVPGYAAIRIPQSVFEIMRNRETERITEARGMFESKARKVGRTERCEWRTDRGDPTQIVEAHGRYADIVVVSQRQPHTEEIRLNDLAEELMLGTGRPVLIVPYAAAPKSIGTRVLVAWDASREAARAVADAMPILEVAGAVEVFVANGATTVHGTDIAAHLARHSLNVEVYTTETGETPIGDALLNRANDSNADLIVMGGYGHSRFRESVFGGVTRHILEHMTVPVLMSH